MAIKFKKKAKPNKLTKFDDLKIGDFFNYNNFLYVKINIIGFYNAFNFTNNRLEEFSCGSTFCTAMDGELTYWEKE